MNARRALAVLPSLGLASCLVMPDLGHWNGYVNSAELGGRSRAEVLAELGPPAAMREDGSAMVYALPDNDWLFVVSFYVAGFAFALDPHWDVRFVAFDRRGIVETATPAENRFVELDTLVDELAAGRWRR